MRRRSVIYTGVLVGSAALMASVFISFTSGDDVEPHGVEAAVECTGSSRIDFDCQERRYTELVRLRGAEAALDDLAAEQERNGYVRAACHQLTHRVGRAAGEISGIDALEEGKSVCASGYYHGVLQAVMADIGADDAIDEAATVCAEMRERDRYSADHYNCVHGLGHGFMEVFASDVFESLRGCDELEDPWEAEKCSGGVFMENVIAIDNPDRPSTSLDPDHPLYPCTVVADRFKEQCYDWQITYAVYLSDVDFAEVFGLCEKTEKSSRDECYRGVGGDALQQSKFIIGEAGRRETLRRLCMLGADDDARSSCIEGAVTIMYRDYTDGAAQARALCRSFDQAGPRLMYDVCLEAREEAHREVPLPESDAPLPGVAPTQ